MTISNQSSVNYSYVLPNNATEQQTATSNTVGTQILTYSVSRVKTSDKTFLVEGESATQQVVITNNSNFTLRGVTLKDIMTSGAKYVTGSTTINGASKPLLNPQLGFSLDDIPVCGSITIEYQITANTPQTAGAVKNYAVITYTVVDTSEREATFTENTNMVTIALVTTRLLVEKSVDKTVAVRGQTLHYTSVIINAGTMEKTQLVFRDGIPSGTTFVNGSVTIGSVPHPDLHPAVGFSLPNLIAASSVTVEFNVVVD